MKQFDLEEARNGEQIVHKDGRKAKDWHYFEGSKYPLYIQWEGGGIAGYMEEDTRIGLAPDQVVEYLPFTENGFWAGSKTLVEAQCECPNAITFYKVSADEDGGNWSMERVT